MVVVGGGVSMTLLSSCNNASFVGNSERFPRWHSSQALEDDVCAHTHAHDRITAALSRRPLRGLIYLSLHYITRSGFRDADVHTPTAALAHQNQVSSDSDNINASAGVAGQPVFVLRGWDIVVLFALPGSVCAKQKRHALITRAHNRFGFKFVLHSLLWNRPFVRLTRFWSINRGYWSSCDPGGDFFTFRFWLSWWHVDFQAGKVTS